MNIFVTNEDPEIAAYEHCSVHCNKQLLEYSQILCTAHRVYGNDDPRLYKATHINHPCSVWARQCLENYQWLYKAFSSLCEVFWQSRGKVHATDKKLSQLLSEPPVGIPSNYSGQVQGFVMAIPSDYQDISVTQSYQRYLNAKFQEWQGRAKPVDVTFPVAKPSWAVVS